MPIILHVLLTCATWPELSYSAADQKQHPSLNFKVNLFIKEKLHYDINHINVVAGQESELTHKYEVCIRPDQPIVRYKLDDTTYPQELTVLSLFHNKLFISNEPSENLMDMLRRTTNDFAREEYNTGNNVPFVIFVDVAINYLENFVFKEGETDDLDRCSVCLKEFEESDQGLIKTPCSHIFHGPCVVDWFRAKKSCPNCRHEFAVAIFQEPLV
ncbi:hypothetical protein ACFE04_014460 [Oxalis oulophora]